MWVLGTEPRSTSRMGYALNGLAIATALRDIYNTIYIFILIGFHAYDLISFCLLLQFESIPSKIQISSD